MQAWLYRIYDEQMLTLACASVYILEGIQRVLSTSSEVFDKIFISAGCLNV